MTDNGPAKLAVLQALLGTGRIVRVILDSRRPLVWVPGAHLHKHNLVLEFGLNCPNPIPDMLAGTLGLTGTLSFGGRPFWVSVPWSAVYAVSQFDTRGNHVGRLWAEDAPIEVTEPSAAPERAPTRKNLTPAQAPATVPKQRRALPPGWRVIDGGKNDVGPGTEPIPA